jgi:hypothetical protein
VHTQLVAIPPSTVVPSHAGLGVCRVYAHSSDSPEHEPPGTTDSADGQVPTSLQAAAANMRANAAAEIDLVMAGPRAFTE